jgi:hypothetical protein
VCIFKRNVMVPKREGAGELQPADLPPPQAQA